MANIVLGVTGSIAAYKAPEIVRLLRKAGCDVRVVMTRAAREFVTELTLRTVSANTVYGELFAPVTTVAVDHIELATWADAVLVAPCTAATLARLAHGLAEDLLSCVLLATRAPVVLAPAMNSGMWEHPATVENVRLLRARGVLFAGPVEGELACGDQGSGRMIAPAEAVAAVRSVLD